MNHPLNQSARRETAANPWAHHSPLPKLSTVGAVLLSLAAVLFSVWTTVGILNLTGFLPLMVSCACAATIFILVRSPLTLLVPISSFGLALLLTRSWALSAASLLYLPAALVIAHCIYRFKSRAATVCRVSLTLALSFALFCAIILYSRYGALNLDILKNLSRSAEDALRAWLAAFTASQDGQTVRIFSDEVISLLLALLITLSPAASIFFLNLLSFVSVKLAQLLFRVFRLTHMLPPQNWKFIISPAGAIVYLVAYLVYLVSSSSDDITVLWAVTANIVLILAPGLFVVGFNRLIEAFRQKRVLFNNAAIIVAAVLLTMFINITLLLSALLIAVLTFLGAIHCIRESGIFRFPSKKS